MKLKEISKLRFKLLLDLRKRLFFRPTSNMSTITSVYFYREYALHEMSVVWCIPIHLYRVERINSLQFLSFSSFRLDKFIPFRLEKQRGLSGEKNRTFRMGQKLENITVHDRKCPLVRKPQGRLLGKALNFLSSKISQPSVVVSPTLENNTLNAYSRVILHITITEGLNFIWRQTKHKTVRFSFGPSHFFFFMSSLCEWDKREENYWWRHWKYWKFDCTEVLMLGERILHSRRPAIHPQTRVSFFLFIFESPLQ